MQVISFVMLTLGERLKINFLKVHLKVDNNTGGTVLAMHIANMLSSLYSLILVLATW